MTINSPCLSSLNYTAQYAGQKRQTQLKWALPGTHRGIVWKMSKVADVINSHSRFRSCLCCNSSSINRTASELLNQECWQYLRLRCLGAIDLSMQVDAAVRGKLAAMRDHGSQCCSGLPELNPECVWLLASSKAAITFFTSPRRCPWRMLKPAYYCIA